MSVPFVRHCDLGDGSPADPLDALEKLYRSYSEGTDKETCSQAWGEAMMTADATLRAHGRDVRAFDDCFDEVQP